MLNYSFWKNKRVLITGHTGFKGSWLTLWLSILGSRIYGVSLDPPSTPNLFNIANIQSLIHENFYADILDIHLLKKIINKIKPDIIFHFAAQSLVQQSYLNPIETYHTNVIGTANVLESARFCNSIKAIICTTTDKCYENNELIYPFRENDRLGGNDPYSNSKACAELVIDSYRKSFFDTEQAAAIASVRAGNVIGGGDWAPQRLIPDCIRAHIQKHALTLRYPNAIRPWQHVLEPLQGYLRLVEKLYTPNNNKKNFASSWNFGSEFSSSATVSHVVQYVQTLLPFEVTQLTDKTNHEATLLRLDSTKAKHYLNWHTQWNLTESINETITWYQHWLDNDDMLTFSCNQIKRYMDYSNIVNSNTTLYEK